MTATPRSAIPIYLTFLLAALTAAPVPCAADRPGPHPATDTIKSPEEPIPVGDAVLRISAARLGGGVFNPPGGHHMNVSQGNVQLVIGDDGKPSFTVSGLEDAEQLFSVLAVVDSGNAEAVATTDQPWVETADQAKYEPRGTVVVTNLDGVIRSIQWLFAISRTESPSVLRFSSDVGVDLSSLVGSTR